MKMEQMATMTRNGWRNHGRRKERLMLQAQLLLIDLQQAGVHIPTLQKLVGLNRPVYDITTKEWSGIIGNLKAFKRENNL